METLFVECPTGLAGDMLLAALLDLGVPRDVVEQPLISLGFKDAFVVAFRKGERVKRNEVINYLNRNK